MKNLMVSWKRCYKKFQTKSSENKVYLSCVHTNYRLLSSLQRTQYKEKWLWWQSKTTLCLQRLHKAFHFYAYHQKTGQMVVFVWGKHDLKMAFELKQRLKEQNITYDCIASDHWQSFDTVFADTNERWAGKQHTQAIEGNNCAIRHRISRAVRKSCCFSKSLFYHIKVFNIGFAYINACHWCQCQKNRI